jgi:hypothetical protein
MTVTLPFRAQPLSAALLLSLLAAPAAQAQTVELEPEAHERGLRGLAFSLDLYGLRRLDDAQKMWENDDGWGAGGLEVGYDVLALDESTRLALAVGWVSEGRRFGPTLDNRSLYAPTPGGGPSVVGGGSMSGELKSNTLQAAAALRWRADSTIQPYLAVALGGTRSQLTLNPFVYGASQLVKSTAHGLIGRASLGLRLQPRRLVARRKDGSLLMAAALGLELGALVGTPLEFSTETPAPPDGLDARDRIPVDTVRMGDMGQTGGYGRVAAILVF